MTIPSSMLSAVARSILKYIPLPNAPNDGTSTDANDFVPHSTRLNKMADVTARADQIWNNSQKTFATLRWYHEDELNDDHFLNAFTGAFQDRIAKGVGVDQWSHRRMTLPNCWPRGAMEIGLRWISSCRWFMTNYVGEPGSTCQAVRRRHVRRYEHCVTPGQDQLASAATVLEFHTDGIF